jgi:lipoprotein-anchoring transpeptidase ErfK/SrfK
MLGLMAVSMAYRARQQRSTTTPTTAAAAPQAAVPTAPPLQRASAVTPAKPTPPKPVVKPEPKFSAAQVRAGKTVALRSKPGGQVLKTVGSTTEFNSPTTLSVTARKGKWLGVTSTDLPNGKTGWVKANDSLKPHTTHISVRIDLSRRSLELRDGRKVVRTVKVGIGRGESATPTGRFAITDKLSGGAYGPYYGCCILALSGHQVNTPAGWQGGDRLAIHGTNNPGSIGVPSSAGCLHADAEDLRVMMRRVPLGTPVFIHA